MKRYELQVHAEGEGYWSSPEDGSGWFSTRREAEEMARLVIGLRRRDGRIIDDTRIVAEHFH